MMKTLNKDQKAAVVKAAQTIYNPTAKKFWDDVDKASEAYLSELVKPRKIRTS